MSCSSVPKGWDLASDAKQTNVQQGNGKMRPAYTGNRAGQGVGSGEEAAAVQVGAEESEPSSGLWALRFIRGGHAGRTG